jgi:integrase/recombinase XerD
MANRRVSVWKYVKIGNNWRYCKPVVGTNNKIKPHWVYVKGVPEEHPEGNFYTMRLEGQRKIWKLIGPNPADALRAAEYEAHFLKAVAAGVPVKKEDTTVTDYGAQMWKYLDSYKLAQSDESHALMEQTLGEFWDFMRKTEMAKLSDMRKLTRDDLLRYKKWLVSRSRSLRTAGNKMLRVNQFLRAALGQEAGKGLVTVKDAKFVEREPEIYTDEEIDVFLAACGPFYALVFNTLLMAGLRKQEMENLEWQDISFDAATLSVRGKKTFQPKDWEERDIEIPRELLEMLFSARKDRGLVFATKTGKKYTHVWDDCKDIAKKVGAELARKARKTDAPEIKQIVDETAARYHPHKFRATYCTKLLQSGIDLKTVQKLMGHKTIESTMRYLAKAESHKVKARVDAVQWKKKPPATVKTGEHKLPLETKLVWSEE